jgi:hypothetical protein
VKKNKPAALWLSNINFFCPALPFSSPGAISEKAEANQFSLLPPNIPSFCEEGFFLCASIPAAAGKRLELEPPSGLQLGYAQ